MTWLSEETKKTLFCDLQQGQSVKSLMAKYNVSRPTVNSIRNTYTVEAEVQDENENESEGESIGESEGESIGESVGDSVGESIGESEDCMSSAEIVDSENRDYNLEEASYLPIYTGRVANHRRHLPSTLNSKDLTYLALTMVQFFKGLERNFRRL